MLGSILGSKVVDGVDSYKTVYKANYIAKRAVKSSCQNALLKCAVKSHKKFRAHQLAIQISTGAR
jgi:hypothetical protein